MQTILGAGGAIGHQLARELHQYTRNIRLVSRNPQKVNTTDTLFPADLSDVSQVDRAIEGSKVVYLTVGFEYNIKAWRKNWPPLMRRVIGACKKYDAKLVFFDNVYMYDSKYVYHMTEETPVRPVSKKGAVREQIAQMLLAELERNELTALIARAADFIGPKNSIPVEMVYKNFRKGKKADWFADVNKVHSFTYTLDAAKATALLGNTPAAYKQVWHLPTHHAPLTGKQWIELFAQEMEVKARYRELPAWLLSSLGVFMPLMREFREMNYQYDRDYFFDSSKFDKRFGLKPTPPQEAVRQTIETLEQEHSAAPIANIK
ncbi:NAD-dependent epimerase/dehydratase family protein [Nafulsella turpanensis]|uniref:NAD-dependent epimerase/dehydratase family protein n=1 Tax=Nafulsella turpanensis TaxID=1265690 RepID=UPI00034AF235|nr:NAD-dependent epimerase/dehydratase family protein [Nafulsella turpanensis]